MDDGGFVHDDGGRALAGYIGSAGDCVTRAVTIASGLDYSRVYDDLSAGSRGQRLSKRSKARVSARDGVNVNRKWFKDYMRALGFEWVPTMAIGQGCSVHLTKAEMPGGRLIACVSKHFTAMIDGVIYDTHDPRRDGTRCVYGYYRLIEESVDG